MKIHDVEQQSREWMQLHVGIPTASGLDNLLTPEFELRKGETPKTYIYRKVAESWRGKPMIDLGGSSFAMEQGLILESEAIPFWELTTGRKITRVGFVTTDDGRFGCSPDGLLSSEKSNEATLSDTSGGLPRGDDVAGQPKGKACQVAPAQSFDFGIEIKCPSPGVHCKYLCDGVIPKEYRAQVYGSMFATGFSKWIFFSYCRGFPPLILEATYDAKAMNAIHATIDWFHLHLDIAKQSIERWRDNPLNEFK